VDKASLDAACRYSWPGNVRELEHLVERAMVFSDAPSLKLAPLIHVGGEPREPVSGQTVLHLLPGNYDESVETYKETLIRDALSRADGSKKEAARLLGMSPSNLSRLLKRLNISA